MRQLLTTGGPQALPEKPWPKGLRPLPLPLAGAFAALVALAALRFLNT